jgi:hypothetical protein
MAPRFDAPANPTYRADADSAVLSSPRPKAGGRYIATSAGPRWVSDGAKPLDAALRKLAEETERQSKAGPPEGAVVRK